MHQDPIETCPYDPVHRVKRSGMPFHLFRCRQNWPSSKKKQCPFDARHLINPLEYNYHVNTCPSRENVMHYKLVNEEESKYQNILPIEVQSVASTDENWDDEPEVRSYDPEKNIQNRAVVRSTVGLSKSKRSQFKMAERRRIQELDANNERQAKILAQVPKEDDNDNEYKPLRRPKKLSDTLNSSALSLNTSNVSAAGEKSTQQKKLTPENQPKVHTSEELKLINEQEEKIPEQAHEQDHASNNAYKPLRRPKPLPTDTLDMSALSLNCSVSSIASEKSMLQKKSTFAQKAAPPPAPKAAPFSYAAVAAAPISYASAASRNDSKRSDGFDVVVEDERYDNDKENFIATNNSSFLSRNGNDSIIEKMSKTVEGLNIDDAAHKKKTELLNKEIEKLKTLKKISDSSTDKKSFKCAANFPVLK